MNKQWNTIKDTEFLNHAIFGYARTFGEIEDELGYDDPVFYYKDIKVAMTHSKRVDGTWYYDVQIIDDDAFTEEEQQELYRCYDTLEELVMNYVFPDGMSFIDFMMTPDEDLEY